MRWKLFATLSETVGENVVDVSIDGEDPTLRDALDALVDAYPDLEPQVLDDENGLQDHIRLLCDGEDPFRSLDGWETNVEAVDELALFPPVSGG